ncbi:glycosyltransferase [Paenibacillus kobensis]|uniref:glycosyltransferase n=1 Tax=Paenibacillus kobensis TaxID=59841 RepID=UPI001FECC765|nr:glycosyltransferase [Paenibacillus kobensis]
MMSMRFVKTAAAGLLAVMLVLPATAAAHASGAAQAAAVPSMSDTKAQPAMTHESNWSSSKEKFNFAMRKLWIDHTGWTWVYIISAIAGLEDQQQVLGRLLRNQVDIGNAIKPYYGEEAGKKLTMLLQEHILLAGKVLEAAKAGNQADLAKYNKEWYRNADDIVRFLSAANPNWNEKQLRDMFYTHLQLITEQVAARLKKDWDADIMAVDRNEDHMIHFADVLSEGIIKQFPKQFQS